MVTVVGPLVVLASPYLARDAGSEREKSVRIGTETVVNTSVVYLTPLPGAGRRRALQLVAGFGRTLDTPADDPGVQATRFLFDTCVPTLRWRTPTT